VLDAARGVFLPQVWESLPAPLDFLRQLRRKAGLAEDGWDEATRLWRFGVEKWSEEPPDD
jgi:AMMECR1 domain-containing protein